MAAVPKSKVAAGILGILLGDFGVHKFYLGETGIGVLYLVFCWTLIPGIIGLVEGIIYLTMSDADFDARYGSGGGTEPWRGPPPPPPPFRSSGR